jgi:DNA-binding protein HU-beta
MENGDQWVCETHYCPECGTRIFCRNVPDRGLLFYLSEEMDREVDSCPVCSLELAALLQEQVNPFPEPAAGGEERTAREPAARTEGDTSREIARQTEGRRRKPAGKDVLVNAVLEAKSGSFSSKAESTRALDSVGEALVGLIAEGQEVRWPGIGTFHIRERKPRRVRNPQTGEMVQVPARKAVTFSPAKHLKEKVEGTEGS